MNKPIFKLFYLNTTFLLFFVLVLTFLIGCAKTTGKVVVQIPHETTKVPQAHFCPRDNCGEILENHIKFANKSVHCAFYNINLKNIIGILAKKSKAIDVKLVMDNSTYKGQVKGSNVKLNNNKNIMHNKFCVIDNSFIITGSFNPTDNDNNHNNNNVIVIYSKTLAENYEDEFGELWNGKFGKGSIVKTPILYINNAKIENYFCPEDKCASRVIELIKNANSSIYFMSFSFTNEDIADALINKNVEIRGIFDSRQSLSKYSQFKRLQEFGINAKKDLDKYTMHHKVFIIDNETVATGSFNPTLAADTKNDENLLIIHDEEIANLFLMEFDSLWE